MSLSKEEKLSLSEQGYRDPVFFCRFFLEELFPTPVPWLHRGLLAILTRKTAFLTEYGELDRIVDNFIYTDSAGRDRQVFHYNPDGSLRMELGRFTVLMLPRGTAKTTVAGNAVPLYDILYHQVPFSVYVSEAAPHAKMQLATVKRQLTDNERVQAVFGSLKPELKDAAKWSEEQFETLPTPGNKRGVSMAARGGGGQIRGIKHLENRPKKIICDDLEDQESVSTAEQRRKLRTWFYGDLKPAISRVDKEATITVLGTTLHKEALLQILAADPEWTVVNLGAVDKNGDEIWPLWMSHEDLAKEKVSFAAAGQLHTYYMEYFNKVVAPELQAFKEEYFIYAPAEDIVAAAIYIDPAISPKRSADETSIIVVGMKKTGVLNVMDHVQERGMSEREKVDTYFHLHQKHHCTKAGVESNAYQAALVHLLREEMFRKKYYFEVEAVTHKVRKVSRIMGVLQPRFAAGYIQLSRPFPKLISQLLDFRPDTEDQPDDGPDSLAGCIALLDPYAPQASGKFNLAEDMYESLEEEGDEWCWAH